VADIEKELGVYGVRGRFRDLEPLNLETSNKSYAIYMSMGPITPLGHVRKTITNTPQSLTDLAGFPTGIKQLDIYNLSSDTDVYFTHFAGQSPGAALGFPIRADSWFRYDSDVVNADFKLVTLSGTASLEFVCNA
jgi:hypothetical protein